MEYEPAYEFDPGMYEAGSYVGLAIFAGMMITILPWIWTEQSVEYNKFMARK